ncbi:MAG: hypothetical protein UGF89_10460 [Acutalibacteraceae bacterium]|nr:hypothetical protein [Acutalibacteraceae bacterium]
MAKKTNNSNSLTPQEENNLSRLSDEFISMLVSAGVVGDPHIEDQDVQRLEQEKNKSCFRCTKLLMEKYRRIVYKISSSTLKVDKELNEPFAVVDKVIDYVDTEYLFRDKAIENKMARLSETRAIIDRLNLALTQLKNDPEYCVYYEALKLAYINKEKISQTEAAYRMGISERTFRRHIQRGLEELTTLLWTTEDVEMSILLDALARIK